MSALTRRLSSLFGSTAHDHAEDAPFCRRVCRCCERPLGSGGVFMAFDMSCAPPSLHSQPCHVVYTEYRPTPLQHYMFPSGGDGIHLIVDEQSSFQPANFQRAASAIKPRVRPKAGKGKGKGKDAGPTDTFKPYLFRYNPFRVHKPSTYAEPGPSDWNSDIMKLAYESARNVK